jgi:plastocyanin
MPITYKRWYLVAAVTFAMLLLTAACGGDDDDNGDNTPVSRTTVAGPTSPAASPTAGTAVTQTPAGGDGEGSGQNNLEIAAENSEEFTKSTLEASAGDVTVTFDNREQGVIHNFAVFESADSTDALASTELTAGPDTQTVTFTIEAGKTYVYHCESHPVMKGELIVQ